MTAAATHDVVVGGGSGLAAAIEARTHVADVVLLQKTPRLGGPTIWSIGSVTATGTPHQARKGVVDTPEERWCDMAGFNGELDARDNANCGACWPRPYAGDLPVIGGHSQGGAGQSGRQPASRPRRPG